MRDKVKQRLCQETAKMSIMKLFILLPLLFCLTEARSFLDEDEKSSEEDVDSKFACQVQGTDLRICRECDPQHPSVCDPKRYEDCRCRDISVKNKGNAFQI